MADNVTIPATGTGTATPVIATDDVGGVQYQRVKLDVGADGTTTPVTVAAPLPVVQTGALPAGTAAIGKLAPNSGVDIGDVDVTSLPAITGTVTANAGTNLNTSALALETGGNLASAVTSLTALIAKFANAIEIAPAATTMTAGAYTALDQVGTLLTFASVVSANGRACRLESMYIGNKANTAPLLQLWLFNAAPTLTSPGDNNPWQPTDGDMATLIDVIDSGQWYAGAATALNQWNRVAGLGRIVVTAASTSIFGYLVLATGGALTGVSTTDLTVRLVVTPDV